VAIGMRRIEGALAVVVATGMPLLNRGGGVVSDSFFFFERANCL